MENTNTNFESTSGLSQEGRTQLLKNIVEHTRSNIFLAEAEIEYLTKFSLPEANAQYKINLAKYEKTKKAGKVTEAGKFDIEKPVLEVQSHLEAAKKMLKEQQSRLAFFTA